MPVLPQQVATLQPIRMLLYGALWSAYLRFCWPTWLHMLRMKALGRSNGTCTSGGYLPCCSTATGESHVQHMLCAHRTAP
jgi:hypothetical protein